MKMVPDGGTVKSAAIMEAVEFFIRRQFSAVSFVILW